MRSAVLGAVMPARLHGLATDMQTELACFVSRPAAHPGFDIGRGVMKNRLFEDDGFRLRFLLRNLSPALQVQPVRFTNDSIARNAAPQFLRDLSR